MERKEFIKDSVLHLLFLVAAIVIDQWSKLWARTALVEKPLVLWKNVFSLRLVYNTGGPWGILGKHTMVLTLFSIVILVGITAAYLMLPKTKKMRWMRCCIVLLTAGAVGNIIDRIRFEKVTDLFSFDLISFPVFNVADICITCGCMLALVLISFYYKDEDFSKWKKSNS